MSRHKYSKRTAFGFDYGARARLHIVGDTAFEGLLRGGLLGLTYEFGAAAGLLSNVPALIMIFRALDPARECFDHFRSWQETTGSGDAVGLSLVEHSNSEFTICIYEKVELFLQSAIPDELREDLEPHYGGVTYSMRFPNRSDGYRSFKAAVETSPFLLVPATKTIPPRWDMAIAKRGIDIFEEAAVPEGSQVAGVLRAHAAAGVTERHFNPPSSRADLATLSARRRKHLRRFYPVTLEQLRCNSEPKVVTEVFKSHGYREWQIEQAICNLNWSRRLHVAKAVIPDDEVDLMTTLVRTWERAELFSSSLDLDLNRLGDQLKADAEQLLDYIDLSNDSAPYADPQQQLEKRGLLEVQG